MYNELVHHSTPPPVSTCIVIQVLRPVDSSAGSGGPRVVGEGVWVLAGVANAGADGLTRWLVVVAVEVCVGGAG